MVASRSFRLSAALAAALLFPGGAEPAAQSAGNVFQQAAADGLVVMEAENFRTNTPQGGHTWDLVTTPAGFVGGAMQANPNSGGGADTNYLTGAPRLDFRVLFTSTGTHYVWVRGRALTAPAIGNNDSCHAGLDGAAIATADRMGGWGDSWTWRTATMDGGPATFTVAAAGVHTVNLWMREDGFIADRILITTNAAYGGVTAGGTMAGPAQSAQIADQSPGAPGTLTATPGIVQILLTWGAATNADTYDVLRSTTAGGPYAPVATGVAATSYVDSGLDPQTTYYYRVVGVDGLFGAGPMSNEASAAPLPIPPRFNDHEEGVLDGQCACSSASGPLGLSATLLFVLLASFVLLLHPRRSATASQWMFRKKESM